MLLTSNPTASARHAAILNLLNTRESVASQDVRTLLGCTAADAYAALEELISQGLVRTALVRNATRYSKRKFDHDPALVKREWFSRLESWFAGGKTESATGIARQLGLDLQQVRATLEEMRQAGVLYGKFVGQMCLYSLRQRGEVSQASAEQLHQAHNTPERVQQRALVAASAAPSARKSRG